MHNQFGNEWMENHSLDDSLWSIWELIMLEKDRNAVAYFEIQPESFRFAQGKSGSIPKGQIVLRRCRS